MRRLTVIVITGIALLTGVGAGVAVAESTACLPGTSCLPRGKSISFAGDRVNWACINRHRTIPNAVFCVSGDARPNAKLSTRDLVIRVYNLHKACVRRVLRPSPDPSDPMMKSYYEFIYTFRAFGCR